jgi:CRISPR/Cas system-associated protein Cas7 (RAMP superfamily)
LQNEELRSLYSSPNKIRMIKPRRMRGAGYVARMEADLREIGLDSADWIYLAQDRNRWQALVNTVMNLRVPHKARKFLTSCVTISFLIRSLLRGVS